MGGGSQPSTTTSKQEPWDRQKPYLEKGFQEADRIYGEGPATYYPGSTYTDMSDPTKAGLGMQTSLATGGNALVDNAASTVNRTLTGQGDNPYQGILDSGVQGMQQTASGQFLNNNPFLDDVYGAASGRVKQDFDETVLPGIASQFGQSGGAGSTMHELALGKAGGELTDSLGTLAANIYGGNYQQERDRQTSAQQGLTSTGAGLYGQGVSERLAALGMAPGLRDAQFGDAQRLQEVGKRYEGQADKVLEDDINRFNYGQNADVAALQDYLSMISGNFGSTSTTRQSGAKGSGLNTALGGGLALLGMM